MSTGNEQIERVRSMYGDGWGRFAERWIGYALRTAPVESSVIAPAIEELYGVAGLGKPRVVIVSSPGVLAFAGTFAAEILATRTTNPTFDPVRSVAGVLPVPASCKSLVEATLAAVEAATERAPHNVSAPYPDRNIVTATLEASYSPADIATVHALSREAWMDTRGAVEEMEALNYWFECMRDGMRDPFGNHEPTDMMVSAAENWAQPLALALFGEVAHARRVIVEAANWWHHSQAGNMWLYDTACIAAARDVGNLELPEHRSFSVWERCQVNGGYSYLHPEFCLVSDFPEILDEASMVHPTQVRGRSLQERQVAPVVRWRDGWLI